MRCVHINTSPSNSVQSIIPLVVQRLPVGESPYTFTPILIVLIVYNLMHRIRNYAQNGKTETRSLTSPNKCAALSNETQPLVPLPESVPTTSNSEHSNTPEIPQCVKRNSRNRRKCPKVQKPEIEIKMAPHRPRKSAPTEYATDEEDMITYDV
ncbi:hypothetical protein TNCV_442491 [Trichonephila clavipes]|nr:hypothetical protein TNCV_442491 [Trichonephila clavipes]